MRRTFVLVTFLFAFAGTAAARPVKPALPSTIATKQVTKRSHILRRSYGTTARREHRSHLVILPPEGKQRMIRIPNAIAAAAMRLGKEPARINLRSKQVAHSN